MRLAFMGWQNRKAYGGDTIIEVLMSIAIVGAVIAGAYALAARSLAEGISASEHSQAIKMAESQVEALKSRNKDAISNSAHWDTYFNIRGASPPVGKNNFCLNTAATSMLDASGNPAANWIPQYNNGGAAFTSNNLKVGTTAQPNTYNAICTNDITGTNPKYFINVSLTTFTDKSPTYLVTVKWTPAGKAPTSQTQLYYRF